MIRAGTFFSFFFFFFYKLESLRVIYESRRWTDAFPPASKDEGNPEEKERDEGGRGVGEAVVTKRLYIFPVDGT